MKEIVSKNLNEIYQRGIEKTAWKSTMPEKLDALRLLLGMSARGVPLGREFK